MHGLQIPVSGAILKYVKPGRTRKRRAGLAGIDALRGDGMTYPPKVEPSRVRSKGTKNKKKKSEKKGRRMTRIVAGCRDSAVDLTNMRKHSPPIEGVTLATYTRCIQYVSRCVARTPRGRFHQPGRWNILAAQPKRWKSSPDLGSDQEFIQRLKPCHIVQAADPKPYFDITLVF